MPTDFVDLHSHSTASDGTFPPEEVVRLAQRSGLIGLALTDHDTVGGVKAAAEEAERLGLAFLPGIEISAIHNRPGAMHLLGYGVDPDSPSLRELSRHQIEGRNARNPKIVAKLQELGVSIRMDEVEAEAKGDVVGRPHIAAVLLRKGYVSSIKQAFDKYLGTKGAAYVDRERLPPRRAIEMIRESGGLTSLAHPIQLRTENDAQLERIVKDLADLGLEAIEVIHSDHDQAWVEKCGDLADRFGLLKTGGSDFHGINKKEIQLGLANGRRIPRRFMTSIEERLKRQEVKEMSS